MAVLLTIAVSNPTVWLSRARYRTTSGLSLRRKVATVTRTSSSEPPVPVTIVPLVVVVFTTLPCSTKYWLRSSSISRSYAGDDELPVCSTVTVYCTRSQASPVVDESVSSTSAVLLIVRMGSTISTSTEATCAGSRV